MGLQLKCPPWKRSVKARPDASQFFFETEKVPTYLPKVNGMGRKKNKPARDVISYDGEIPDWAMEEARNHIKQNRDRFQFSSEPTQKYYVVYSLRGPAALNRRCGIYTEWYGIGGAEEQTRGCANKSEFPCARLNAVSANVGISSQVLLHRPLRKR